MSHQMLERKCLNCNVKGKDIFIFRGKGAYSIQIYFDKYDSAEISYAKYWCKLCGRYSLFLLEED